MIDKLIEKMQNNPRVTVVIASFFIGVVVIIGIISILFIWMPNDNSVDYTEEETENIKNTSINYFENIYMADEDVLEKYLIDVLYKLKKGDQEDLYDLVSEDYIKFYNLDKADLFYKLEDRELLYKDFKIDGGNSEESKNYNMLYEVSILSENEKIRDRIVIIEKYMNDYSLSLDGFVSYSETDDVYISEGIKLKVKKRTEYVTKITYEVELTNVSDHDIILNYSHSPEIAYLVLDNGTEIFTSAPWLSTEDVVLSVGTVVNGTMEFDIPRLYAGNIERLKLKNIYDTYSKEEKEIEIVSFN